MKNSNENNLILDYELFFESQFVEFQNEVTSLINEYGKIFLTSSFQSQSLPLLHMVSRLKKKIDILFIDTGYLFPETYLFVEKISDLLGIQVKSIKSSSSFIDQVVSPGKFLFSEDNEKCCYINKVYPLQQAYKEYDVWISGIRADQSFTRANKQRIERNSDGIVRFHPMLNWTAKHIYLYRKKYALPSHPLEQDGYLSIGCMPCTTKYCESFDSQERDGRCRWTNTK